jgi:catechol 2,3-dioxygenase-like lactoylglutathione lyase family enzyme
MIGKQSEIRAVVIPGIPLSTGAPMAKPACKVVGIDHISIRVSDYKKSKAFYGRLFEFLGFEISDEYPNTIGWTNGKTRYWIAPAEGRKKHRIGDVGLHHYAFELRNRRDVDALQAFLKSERVRIVDPADEYYEDYYAVFFLDPDGIKLEGMKYGELTAKRKRKSLKNKG